ncbi:hypothetical protein EVAR_18140_1 [Eumeta japonica]|uniref:Uncharacterized protein n=1 Tax=Eumeta variegata TaxID=151549 RepID=A0A4C1UV31_EUMVA|nr:hypothetical protein EVAR_18140_1 [Eumeta japonica]
MFKGIDAVPGETNLCVTIDGRLGDPNAEYPAAKGSATAQHRRRPLYRLTCGSTFTENYKKVENIVLENGRVLVKSRAEKVGLSVATTHDIIMINLV